MCSPRGPGCMLNHAARDSKIAQFRQNLNCPSPRALSMHAFVILLDVISCNNLSKNVAFKIIMIFGVERNRLQTPNCEVLVEPLGKNIIPVKTLDIN